jgi:uncharacterized membrane protein YkoI
MRNRLHAAVVLMATLAATGRAYGQEKVTTRDQLPPAVDSAVTAQTRNAKLRGLSEEREKGHTYYEAELRAGGYNRDVLMDSSGTVVEVEQQVSLDSLPAKLKAALTTEAGDGRITQVEALSKHGRLVAYEAQVVSKGKRREIQVGPGGEKLAHPE